jgi:hypothetical protein
VCCWRHNLLLSRSCQDFFGTQGTTQGKIQSVKDEDIYLQYQLNFPDHQESEYVDPMDFKILS